jgi:flagellar protein FliL
MVLDKSEIDADSAIELDKLEIPTLPSKNFQRKEPQRIPVPESKVPLKPAKIKGLWWKLSIVAGVLIVTAVCLILYEKKDINLQFYTDRASKVPANYLKVGPVTATIGNNDILRLTLEINCKNRKIKNDLKRMDSKIRDKIVNVLNKPDTQQLIKSNDYDTLRARMKKNLNSLLPDEAIEDIYFSQILTY